MLQQSHDFLQLYFTDMKNVVEKEVLQKGVITIK